MPMRIWSALTGLTELDIQNQDMKLGPECVGRHMALEVDPRGPNSACQGLLQWQQLAENAEGLQQCLAMVMTQN